jgi:hypothetical protein
MKKQCCRTCDWWARTKPRAGTARPCFAPVPASVVHRLGMDGHDGVTCPCWKERSPKGEIHIAGTLPAEAAKAAVRIMRAEYKRNGLRP